MEVRIHWGFSCGDYSDNRKRTQQLVSEPSILGKERRLESRQFDAGITENRRKLESQQSDARWKKNMPLFRNIISSKPGVEVAAADKESSLVEEDDLIVQLQNLKQVLHLQSYIEAFEELNSRAGIEEDQALSIFLSGLLDEIRKPVCMFKPRTLDEAYALAKLQELTINVLGRDRIKQYENEVDYSTKEWKLDSEMEDETYADEGIDLDEEIDVDRAIADEDLMETMDANSSSYCNIDFEQLECNRSPVQKTEELEPEPAVCSIEVSMMEDDGSIKQLSGVQVLISDDSEQNPGVETLNTDDMEQNGGVEVFDKNDAMNVDEEEEVEESDVSVVLPISTCYSRSLSWLLNWFPRPTVKLKFVAQRDDELYEEWGSHESHEEGKLQPISSITDLQSYKLSSYQKSASYRAMENLDAELERIVVPPRFIVEKLDVISPISAYYCVSLWMFIWGPKPMVKMKLELFLLWKLLREADMLEVLKRKATCQDAHAWSPKLPPLFENAAASALAASGMDSRMLEGSNNIPELNLGRIGSQMTGSMQQAPFVDPLYLQYLGTAEFSAAQVAALNDQPVNRNYLGESDFDLFQKAYLGNLLPGQNSEYGVSLGGKTDVSSSHGYYGNLAFWAEIWCGCKAVERLDHGKETEFLANVRRNAPSRKLTAILSVIRNLKGFLVRFPKPTVRV